MLQDKETKNSKLVWNDFTVRRRESTLVNKNLYSVTHPRRTAYAGVKNKRAMSLEKEIEEMESKGRRVEEKVQRMRVRARNLEERIRILERRTQLIEKRTLILKENRRCGGKPKVRLTIEPGKPLNIAFCGSPSNDEDFSVSNCGLQMGGLVRSESVDVFDVASKSKPMIESQFCIDAPTVGNDNMMDVEKIETQNSGVKCILNGIQNLKLPRKQEEGFTNTDMSSTSNDSPNSVDSSGNNNFIIF
uniref:Uncharacterized protein n=1 Tax=Strongyloides papillosus TaxID=174720 RepID=A0A0N5BMU7_STREA